MILRKRIKKRIAELDSERKEIKRLLSIYNMGTIEHSGQLDKYLKVNRIISEFEKVLN